ncbi:MAG: FAD:protein FMN transferase [Gammaproteobacteria bacterium]|jgi:FAD:protein FMN transferase
MKRPIALLMVLAALLLSGCSQNKPYKDTILDFGTLINITLYTDDPAQARQAFKVARQDFDYMQHTWNAWHPGPLGRVNLLLPTGSPFTAPPSVLPLIKLGTTLSRQSGGLFNPAIGKLLQLWGFESDTLPKGPPPPLAKIQALLKQHPTMADLHVDGIRLSSTNPAVRLDFGGFAKGYGVDRVMERFRAMGIHNALIDAGGDLRAIGRHGDRPWRIGIRNPDQADTALAWVDIQGDESVFTSGDYERYYMYHGKRYHHIIDPRSGYPSAGVSSATVILDGPGNGARADAAATALMIAGIKDWARIAKGMHVSQIMLIDHQGEVYMTPAMAKRIHFTKQPPAIHTLQLNPGAVR